MENVDGAGGASDWGAGEPMALDAVAIVGALADGDRRQVVAALILGDAALDGVVHTTGLAVPAAAKALGRLVDIGLVVRGDEGGLHLLGESFRIAARQARMAEMAPAEAAADRPEGRTAEQDRVFRVFVKDGRIVQIPTSHAKRMVLLDWLAQEFEIGRRYSEKMVNLIIGRRHADTAAWRRYLVDHEFLDRADGEYWRAGGTVDTARRRPMRSSSAADRTSG